MRVFPSGAHIAEVEIDPDTGWIAVVDYTAVDDIGNVINSFSPMGSCMAE